MFSRAKKPCFSRILRKIKEEVYEKFQGNEAACSRNQR